MYACGEMKMRLALAFCCIDVPIIEEPYCSEDGSPRKESFGIDRERSESLSLNGGLSMLPGGRTGETELLAGPAMPEERTLDVSI